MNKFYLTLFLTFILQLTLYSQAMDNFVVINSSEFEILYDDIQISYDGTNYISWAPQGITLSQYDAIATPRFYSDTIKIIQVRDLSAPIGWEEIHGVIECTLRNQVDVKVRAFRNDETGIYRIEITSQVNKTPKKFIFINHINDDIMIKIEKYCDGSIPILGAVQEVTAINECSTIQVNLDTYGQYGIEVTTFSFPNGLNEDIKNFQIIRSFHYGNSSSDGQFVIGIEVTNSVKDIGKLLL